MIRFIQSLPNIVDRMVASISSPSVQDMIIRIVSSEEAGVSGVIDWLATESLIPRLIALLSPTHPTTMHGIAAESLKTIITLCAPSPFNPHGGNAMEQQGQQAPGTRDNRLIRELVSEKSIGVMVKYMFEDLELTDRDWKGAGEPSDPFIVHPLPSISSATSSLSHICNILVELIRRNNSDFSEPHLFHTMRNRLMSMRIQNENEEDERKRMETAMGDFSEKMGIVHLGSLLTLLSEKFVQLHRYLLRPRSQARAASASNPKPLTVERFRIVELYAELLHSSNMSILNRAPGTGPAYSSEGILSGGLAGLEALGEAIEGDRVGEETEEQVTQARELPVSSGSTDCSLTGSEEVESDELEDMDETPSQSPAAAETLDPPAPSQADVARLRDVMSMERPASESVKAVAATTIAPSISEYENEKDQLPPGDRLKQIYIQHRVLPSVVDLFFEYPNNDFMHHVVYDLLQQILNGRLGPGLNRELVIELICGAKLIERLLDAQRLNDKLTWVQAGEY